MSSSEPGRARLAAPLVWPSLVGVAFGAAYGLVCRAAFQNSSDGAVRVAFPVMSIAFLCVVPLAMGAITVLLGDRAGRRSALYWIFAPWLPVMALFLVVFALAWEGLLCLVMAAPIVLAAASLGGLAAQALLYLRRRDDARRGGLGLALLPFLVAPIESRLPQPDALRDVETRTLIEADAASVWRQVVRVPAIGADELRPSAFHLIGIPRPLLATLDHEGLGGLREASFHGGIRFRERVREWEPRRVLGFSIEVVPGSVAPYVLDEHVRVGGEHFDVLYGRFRLEPLGPRRTRLVLSSRHRLTTHFNAYAGLWSDAVMRDLQDGICDVIRRRSEAAAP